jgi:hypothetical protein
VERHQENTRANRGKLAAQNASTKPYRK